jgi:hypothetical protein
LLPALFLPPLQPWRWRWYILQKCWTFSTLHSVTIQKIMLLIVTIARTWSPSPSVH